MVMDEDRMDTHQIQISAQTGGTVPVDKYLDIGINISLYFNF